MTITVNSNNLKKCNILVYCACSKVQKFIITTTLTTLSFVNNKCLK